MSRRPVTLAVIIGAHGVGGEVRLKLFADSVESLKAHTCFNEGELTLISLRPGNNGPIGRFAEIADRTAAEQRRGLALTVPRASLPALADGEYYHTDLIGLPCISSDGAAVGHCVAVENFGAGDILDIEKADGKRFMVPMTKDAVPAWGDAITIDARFVD